MAIEKMKILGAVLELSAHPIWPIWPNFEVNGLVAPKRSPGLSFFLIVRGAEYSFYVKSIATYVPAFLGFNNSILAIVYV